MPHDQPALPSQSEDCFQQLADGVPVMIWMSGLDMGCFYFNRAWLDFRGRTLEQEFGNGWAEGVHPEDLDRCVNHYIGCFERRIAFAMSYRLQDHAGNYQWILDRGVPHHLPDGTFLGFFGGCAEIETETSTVRHRELATSLADMQTFAQRIGAEAAVTARVARDSPNVSLQVFARSLQGHHEDRVARMKHAVDEMAQLAHDMATFGRIPRGACLP